MALAIMPVKNRREEAMNNNLKINVSLHIPITLIEHLKEKAFSEKRNKWLDYLREAIFEKYPEFVDDTFKNRQQDRELEKHICKEAK
jgi:hypothetical protein